jgi:Uma2 family endonuclease
MTDDELFSFCSQNKNVKIERDENNQILIMAPTGIGTSSRNLNICALLFLWNSQSNSGKVFDSNAGFFLPDKSMLSPDAAWMSMDKWNSLSEDQKEKFAYITPDFIVELMSPSDRLKALKKKMVQWINNEVKLAWLIDPKSQQIFIYRADGTVDKITSFDKKLSGEDVLPGFELDLSILK